jgi:Rrf2 family transcriptional regulator, iron-sulfur cluster assembly transcription factor
MTMRLTTKGRFAVTAMIDLGLRQHRGPVTLAGISQRQRISLSYLEQLFAKLRRHQLVESTRGPGGGYRLAKPMELVSVADIIFAVDEPMDTPQFASKENGDNEQRCSTLELWSSLNRQMIDFLDSVSLRDLVDQQKSRAPQTSAATSAAGSTVAALSDA